METFEETVVDKGQNGSTTVLMRVSTAWVGGWSIFCMDRAASVCQLSTSCTRKYNPGHMSHELDKYHFSLESGKMR